MLRKTESALRRRAESGDSNAQAELANSLLDRHDRTATQEAIHWLRLAAQSDNAWAQYHLGLMYATGDGLPRSNRKAIEWYERSASQGFDSAILNLGILVAHGRGKDFKRAVALYRRAARLGNRNAMYNLGLYYETGRGDLTCSRETGPLDRLESA